MAQPEIPVPASRFVTILCYSCNSESIIYTMAKSRVNCRHCGNELAVPTGGKAKLHGSRITKVLIDTNIVHQLINGTPLHSILNIHGKIILIVLDRILKETSNMEAEKFSPISTDQIYEKLSEKYTVEKKIIDHAEQAIIDARILAESKKYTNSREEPLSETDCMLLLISKKDGYRLATHDKGLLMAAEKFDMLKDVD